MSRDIRVRSCAESPTRGKAILLVHVPTHSQRFSRSRTCQILYYDDILFLARKVRPPRDFASPAVPYSVSHAHGICLSSIRLIAYPYAVLRVGYNVRVHIVLLLQHANDSCNRNIISLPSDRFSSNIVCLEKCQQFW